MKIAAIILFILSALSGIRSAVLIMAGIALLLRPDSGIELEVFVPQAVGMLLVPVILLILGLVLWKKAKRTQRSLNRG